MFWYSPKVPEVNKEFYKIKRNNMKKKSTKSKHKNILKEIIRKEMYRTTRKDWFESRKSYKERVEWWVWDIVEKICFGFKLCKKR